MAENNSLGLQCLAADSSRPIHAIMIIQIMNANHGPREIGRVDSFRGSNKYPAIGILHRDLARHYLHAFNVRALKASAKVFKQPVIAPSDTYIDLDRIHSIAPYNKDSEAV